MKKIGILTFHWADNYGAVYQTMALYEWVKNNTNNQVQVVNYICKEEYENYKFINLRNANFKQGIWRIYNALKHAKPYFKKKSEFYRFRKLFARSKQVTKEDLINNKVYYDLWITGSDQVWNIDIVRKDLEIYTLSFLPSDVKKISYAASGCDYSVQKSTYQELFCNYIRRLDDISVRETALYEYLKSKEIKNVSVSLDPTFLLEKGRWIELSNSVPSFKGDYIFVYCLSNEEIVEDVLKQVNVNNYKVLICGNPKINAPNSEHITPSPIEFLSLILHSKLNIVSSFHGTVFSIIFEKEFYSVVPDYASGRVEDICKLLGLEDRLIKTKEDSSNIETRVINYCDVSEILSDRREQSKMYLKKWIC